MPGGHIEHTNVLKSENVGDSPKALGWLSSTTADNGWQCGEACGGQTCGSQAPGALMSPGSSEDGRDASKASLVSH